ncbi:hypothetical protein [Neobittarella massiliensis]|uniref:Uncharacterized protein n=2 Tax=Oscillospiraceae TaxID=216572 RepID=A0A8J6IQ52_9FIRM|nr:hypothetical protein [Neobittarella massiliensis]MBC3516910.1 hypothetical protein [Neobittarella massiliensis]SCJ81803.1 Uncharacterised protein [uncultured Anaerotruncus sp.]
MKFDIIQLLAQLLRDIPEVLLLMWGLYTFAGRRVSAKNYCICGAILVLTTIGSRMLPLANGVYVILNVIILILLAVNVCKIEVLGAIKSSLMVTLLLILGEGINVVLLQLLFKDQVLAIFGDPVYKSIAGVPALVFLALSIAIVRLYRRRKNTAPTP